jgi:enoyl-CoA hydratase/carnithine racemase
VPSGEFVDAAEASRIGLVLQALPADALLPRAEAMAAK